jgi:hypothetical protein
VLNVNAKAGSLGLLASNPMQYWPAARLPIAIVPLKLSLPFSVAAPPPLQVPAAPSENK